MNLRNFHFCSHDKRCNNCEQSWEASSPEVLSISRWRRRATGKYNFLVFEEMSVTGINKKQFSIRVSLDDEVISEYKTLAGNE